MFIDQGTHFYKVLAICYIQFNKIAMTIEKIYKRLLTNLKNGKKYKC